MNKPVTIYAIVRLESGDAYVGSSSNYLERRRHHRWHLRSGKHHCSHLQKAWDRYGVGAFDFFILEAGNYSSRDERYLAELAWISALGSYNTLVPSSRSGQFAVPEEQRARLREHARLKVEANPAYRAFLAERGAAMAARSQSDEGRAAMSVHTARRWKDPIERAKLEKGVVNRWSAAGAREKHSCAMRKHKTETSAEHSAAMKAAWADPVKGSKLRSRQQSRWADPDAKSRQAEKMRAYHAARRLIQS